MTGNTPIDVEAAVLSPTEHFARPEDVVAAPGISKADKRRILESWIEDAELLSQAEAENMPGGEQPLLREAHLALDRLGD